MLYCRVPEVKSNLSCPSWAFPSGFARGCTNAPGGREMAAPVAGNSA